MNLESKESVNRSPIFFIVMGWRILYIEEALRLNYKLNSIGVMHQDEVTWICLDEIDCVIIESLTCNTTIKLLSEISKKGINVIICDESHLPIAIINCINNNQRTAKYNKLQLEWDRDIKKIIWTKIIKNKISMQTTTLIKLNKTDKVDMMMSFYNDVDIGDTGNREGLAAKVYFRELFGPKFTRERNSENIYNASLNFAYQIIRSKIAQEIVGHGYNPTIGIFHCSEYNYFGLADDLIESYRPIVDYFVIKLIDEEEAEFMTSIFKEKLLNILYKEILYGNTKRKIYESIQLYVCNILDSLTNGNDDNIIFPTFLVDIDYCDK